MPSDRVSPANRADQRPLLSHEALGRRPGRCAKASQARLLRIAVLFLLALWVASLAACTSATPTPLISPASPSATPDPLPATATLTAIPAASATATAAPPTDTPIPPPTATLPPRRVRLHIPEELKGRSLELQKLFRDHPEFSFLVELVGDSAQVARDCQEGRADLGLVLGPAVGQGLVGYPYHEVPVAAVVSFTKQLEQVSLEQLRAVYASDAGARAALGITETLAWQAAAPALVQPGAEAASEAIASPDVLLARVRADRRLVALLPYAQVKPEARALRIDGLHPGDAGYPLVAQEQVIAGADPRMQQLAQALSAALRPALPAAPAEIDLAMVGDMMLARDMGDMLRQHGPDYAYGAVRRLLSEADITLGNLECVISERGEPEPKAYVFRAPLTATLSLRDAGFDVLNLANNHILDYGVEAMGDTFDQLRGAGIAHIGAGMTEAEAHAPVHLEVNGLRLAFLGYANYPTETSTGFPAGAFVAVGDRPGIAWGETERIRREVAAAKSEADLVIVALHGGREYWEVPTEFQQEAARAAIDAGAALVWGHHAHSWQGVEFYGDGVILYSLGDFVFDQMTTNNTGVARLRLDARGVRQLELVPVLIGENGRPAPAEGATGRAILDWFYSLSDLLQQGG